jgi:hypothetical protein
MSTSKLKSNTSTSSPSCASKERRILGEVQLEVDLSGLRNHRSSLPTKRISEVLSDQRNLKEQYNATAQQLYKRYLFLFGLN